MGIIKKLAAHEAHKIAAGEVVERPASVVKELVENALDAQATAITIYIERSGTQLIRIVDNGLGMDQDDAWRCFEHHATSKITTVHELEKLRTFGFRGEALSSIAAVSKITLITRQATFPTGIKVVKNHENDASQEESCPIGTDIAVHDLFFNVPARKKFLKSEATEWRHIIGLFQAFCFSYPSVHFRLFSENELVYNCPPSNSVANRSEQIFESAIAQNIKQLTEHHQNGIKISGCISALGTYRYDRGAIFFFANSRWIKNNGLTKALMKAYLGILPPDKFPVAIIHIEVLPDMLDVNIHPRKEEVAFAQQREIEKALQLAVKNCLANPNLSVQNFHSKQLAAPLNQLEKKPAELNHAPYSYPENTPAKVSFPIYRSDFVKNYQSITVPTVKESPFAEQLSTIAQSWKLLACYANTYLLIEHPDGLLMIDQHAAHERILYEKFKHRFGALETVPLLFPDVIELSQEDLQTAITHKELFEKHGILIDQLNKYHLVITAVATHLKTVNRQELMREIIPLLQEQHGVDSADFFKEIHEKLHAQMACKAAVKAGDQLTTMQQQQLIDDLVQCENQIACPHGRPTRLLLSTHEIEKRFKRKI